MNITFKDLQLDDCFLKALAQKGYIQPTPVQQASIPVILQGKDVFACAQTGTGKTAAFALPLLQLLKNDKTRQPDQIKVLILTPTRELAIQIGDNFADYAQYTSIRHTVIFGGVSQSAQVRAIEKGVNILIATPGRLLDLITQKIVSLGSIEHLILDEADRMLDMGFIHDIKKILKIVPAQRQTLFFSATIPQQIQALSQSILHHPEYIAVSKVSSTAEQITQSVHKVSKEDKMPLLIDLLQEIPEGQVLVFARTKHGADKIAKKLNKAGIKADALHGDKGQNARQRALDNFKGGQLPVLVATDIASRGIDVEELPYVINYDLPEVGETYVHRIGRTGRNGQPGTAISFCSPEEEQWLKGIQKTIGKSVPVATNAN